MDSPTLLPITLIKNENFIRLCCLKHSDPCVSQCSPFDLKENRDFFLIHAIEQYTGDNYAAQNDLAFMQVNLHPV